MKTVLYDIFLFIYINARNSLEPLNIGAHCVAAPIGKEFQRKEYILALLINLKRLTKYGTENSYIKFL